MHKKTNPYFEVHIVVKREVIEQEMQREVAIGTAKIHAFWASTLSHDEGDEEKSGDMILTTRRSNEQFAKDAIKQLVEALRAHEIPVARYKIERVSLDSKHADELKLLEV